MENHSSSGCVGGEVFGGGHWYVAITYSHYIMCASMVIEYAGVMSFSGN